MELRRLVHVVRHAAEQLRLDAALEDHARDDDAVADADHAQGGGAARREEQRGEAGAHLRQRIVRQDLALHPLLPQAAVRSSRLLRLSRGLGGRAGRRASAGCSARLPSRVAVSESASKAGKPASMSAVTARPPWPSIMAMRLSGRGGASGPARSRLSAPLPEPVGLQGPTCDGVSFRECLPAGERGGGGGRAVFCVFCVSFLCEICGPQRRLEGRVYGGRRATMRPSSHGLLAGRVCVLMALMFIPSGTSGNKAE